MKNIRIILTALLVLCMLFSMVMPAFTVGADTVALAEQTSLPDFGLPVISINMEQPASAITKEEQLPATFSMYTEDEYEIIDEEITIKGRGNSTWRAPKKPYQIKFDSKTDILGMGKAKKWVLLANYYDQTSVRNYLAFDLALKLGMDYTPLMRFVDVYINGEYMGNYIISEKIESGDSRVDISDDGLILEVNSLLDENYNFTTKNGVPFSIKEPEYDPISEDMSEEEKQEITDSVTSIEAEIAAIEDMIYALDEKCFDYIDMDSFVDWYIVNELYKNVDASFKKSCYMYRDGTGKFYMGPIWDFDLALGGTESENMRDPSSFHVSSQRWYRRLRLMPEFEAALQARWTQIRNNGTLDSFFDTLDETLKLIDTSAKENLKIWPYQSYDNSYGETILNLGMEIDYIKEFYASRLIWMDASLNSSPSRVKNAETMIKSLPETLVLSSSRYIKTVNDYISSLDSVETAQIDQALLEKLRITNEKYDNLDKTLGIKSVDISSQIVYKNELITFNCITSADVNRIAIFNENSSALGKINETMTLLEDGSRLWTFSCSFGSTGTREVRIKAISENDYEAVPFKIIVLNTNQSKPNKTALSALISEAEAIDLSDKTEESVNVFNEALAKAKQTLADPLALQAAIDKSFNALSDAIDALETNPDNPVIEAEIKPYKIVNVVSGVHVYWNAVDGVSKYGLWRSETGKNGTYKWIANPTTYHFTDTKVESGKTYYYKVSAMNTVTNQHSKMSEAIGITYVATPDITLRVNRAVGIGLRWDKISGAKGYAIYRKSYSGDDAWVRIATISDPNTLNWDDISVKNNNGEVYKYTIRALAGSDLKTLSGCRNAGRTMVRLTSRTLNSATKASSTSIKCNWSTTSQATGYEVRFMVGDTVYKTYTIGDKNISSKTFTGLKKGQTYKIQVRTYKKVDGVGSFYSAWSTAKNVTL